MKAFFMLIGGPTVLMLIGGLVSLGGALWAAIEKNQSSEKIDRKNEEIARLNREIAQSITGGDSFCYLMPTGDSHQSITLVHSGKFPLYDLSARIVDLDVLDKFKDEISLEHLKETDTHLNLGNMPSNSGRLLGQLFKIDGERKRLNIFFSARNGFFTQELRMMRTANGWKSAFRITRCEGSGTSTTLFTEIPDDYPQKSDGSIDWN